MGAWKIPNMFMCPCQMELQDRIQKAGSTCEDKGGE